MRSFSKQMYAFTVATGKLEKLTRFTRVARYLSKMYVRIYYIGGNFKNGKTIFRFSCLESSII